jgi:4-nitrophenyl phosphatase
VLDLDGVVWLADRPIPGSAEAVGRLRSAGEAVVFVTNMSYRRRRDVAAKLAAMGIDPGDDVLTSAMAAATLVAPGERVLVVGGPGLVEEVEARGATVVRAGDADAVLVGYDPAFDYSAMTAAATAVRRGARLLASNDDATYPTPDGPVPGGGAILASIERACGCRAVVAGKPHEPMRDLVRARVGARGIVVGDRPETDGAFARALGFAFALVLSGVTRPGDPPGEPVPDLVGADLAAVVDRVLAGDAALPTA